MESREREYAAGQRSFAWEGGDVLRAYQAMREEKFPSSWLRKDGEDKEGRIIEVDGEKRRKKRTKRSVLKGCIDGSRRLRSLSGVS